MISVVIKIKKNTTTNNSVAAQTCFATSCYNEINYFQYAGQVPKKTQAFLSCDSHTSRDKHHDYYKRRTFREQAWYYAEVASTVQQLSIITHYFT